MDFNKKSGITLIALVITIIVLLILAGVSISVITGENGIVTKARKAKEETEIAEIKEKVDLAATTAMASGLGTITENGLREELDKEFDEYTVEDATDGWNVKVDGYEVFVPSSEEDNNDVRKINVEISQTTGENLWNNIVTLNVTLEGVNTTLTLEQKQELAAYLLDYEDYEDLTTNLTTLTGTTIEEIISRMGMRNEADLVDNLVMAMINSIDYGDVNKLEELGVPVVTITTPYNTKLYTNALDNRELKLGFVENGSYEFEIKSGGTTVTETVEISNIRDYSTESPYDVNIEGKFVDTDSLSYAIDDSTDFTLVEEGTLASTSNSSITFKINKNSRPLSYVVQDEEYFKYFSNGDWEFWHGWMTGDFVFAVPYSNLKNNGVPTETLETMTSRQIIMYAAFIGDEIAPQVLNADICDWTWFDYITDAILPVMNGKTVDEDEIKTKYPKKYLGQDQVINNYDTADKTVTIELTEDTSFFIRIEENNL